MQKILLYLCCIFVCLSNVQAQDREKEDITFAHAFLAAMAKEAPFTLEDEHRFLGNPCSWYGALLLIQLNILQGDLNWVNGPPTKAYLGNLLKMNRHIFQKEGSVVKLEAIVPSHGKNESYFIQILQESNNDTVSQVNINHRKIIVLSILTTTKGDKVVQIEDSSIDNQSIPYLLGFITGKRKGQSIAVLPDDIVAKLHDFMKNQ